MSNYPVCSCCSHDDDWICANCNELTELAALLERMILDAREAYTYYVDYLQDDRAGEECLENSKLARVAIKRLRGDK